MPKRMIKVVFTTHRVLGTLLSFLFLVWFLSAFVMMYHSFPMLTPEEIKQKLEVMDENLPPLDSVLSQLPTGEKVKQITLSRQVGFTAFQIETDQNKYVLPAKIGESAPEVDSAYINKVARIWCKADIVKIDTLNELDQWIPFEQVKKEFPIYKFYYNDEKEHQLYVGSKSGKPLQFTDRDSRLWAYLGAIPHWVYFAQLRSHTDLWKSVVVGSSLIGCFMVISGMWIGIDVWRKTRKKKNKYNKKSAFSPYKKKWYHWHYLTGIVFGITVFTFCFSGMMSLVTIPQWICKTTLKENPVETIASQPFALDSVGDYRVIFSKYKEVKEIEWRHFGNVNYWMVRNGKKKIYLDATDEKLLPLQLTKDEVVRTLSPVHPHHQLDVYLLNEFETHYRDMSRMHKGKDLLPVWKVTVNDPDESYYYILPTTGEVKYLNRADRLRYWTYTALHRLRIPGLNSSPNLRKTVLWVLLLGGTAVSLTGVVLGVGYIKRKCKRRPVVKPRT